MMHIPLIIAHILGAVMLVCIALIVAGVWWMAREQDTRDEMEGVYTEGGWLYDEEPHPDVTALSEAGEG